MSEKRYVILLNSVESIILSNVKVYGTYTPNNDAADREKFNKEIVID